MAARTEPASEHERIGDRLKRLRIAAGLSQRQLASPGVSYAYISRIEASTRQPSVKALRKLAAKLGVTVGYLETGIDRTQTDELAEQLLEATGAEITIRLRPGDAHVEFTAAGGEQLSIGWPLTATLIEALSVVSEIARITADQARLEAELAELQLTGTARG